MKNNKPFQPLLLIRVNNRPVAQLAKLYGDIIKLPGVNLDIRRIDIDSYRLFWWSRIIVIRFEGSAYTFRLNRALAHWLDKKWYSRVFFQTIFFFLLAIIYLASSGFQAEYLKIAFFVINFYLFSFIIRANTREILNRKALWIFILIMPAGFSLLTPTLLLFIIFFFCFSLAISEFNRSRLLKNAAFFLSWIIICIGYLAALPYYYELLYSIFYTKSAESVSCVQDLKKVNPISPVQAHSLKLTDRAARLHSSTVGFTIHRHSGPPIFLSCGEGIAKDWFESMLFFQAFRVQASDKVSMISVYSPFQQKNLNYIVGVFEEKDRAVRFSFLLSDTDSLDFLLEFISQALQLSRSNDGRDR